MLDSTGLALAVAPLRRSNAGEVDATLLILVAVAAIAGYLVYDFVRNAEGKPLVSVIAAIVGHLLFLVILSQDLSRLSCVALPERHELLEFEVAELPEPKPPEPEREKEPEPEPEPEPEVKPEIKPEPMPKPKQKVKEAPVDEQPVSDEPPPPMRFDMSNVAQGGGASGVAVEIGTPGGVPGGTGKPGGKGKGTRPPEAETGGDAVWEPRSEIFVKKLPDPVKVPKINCPASLELGIEGTVVLKVQVRRDGTVRQVTVSKGFDKRCDKVARDALRKARFKPAVATNGKPVDYELRYEYEFRLTQ